MEKGRDDQPVVVIDRSDSGIGAFVLGIAMGAGLALLFAPRSGEEVRRELKNQGRRLRATAAEKAEELHELLSGGYEDTKTRVETGIANARDVIEEKRDDARDAISAGKAAVHSAREELERRLSESKSTRKNKRRSRARTVEDEVIDEEMDVGEQ